MSVALFRVYLVFSLVVMIATLGAVIQRERRPHRARARAIATQTLRATSQLPMPNAPWPNDVHWIAAGGGPTPEFNQVSLEDDLALAAQVLGVDRGAILFAGGAGSPTVQVLDSEERGEDLRVVLADFFDARQGRDAHYERVRVPTFAAATRSGTLDAFRRALRDAAPRTALTFYLAGHGERGEAPADASLLMWGEEAIRPADLASVLEEDSRASTVRVVITSCYSGGFGSAVYRNAKTNAGLIDRDLCGFFATTWDEQASGCDPNPDRGMHEGYGVHFLHALRGQDRQGNALPRTEIDFDGDNAVSFLEAHTLALLRSASIDVPTTSSQTFLRNAAPSTGTGIPVPMPENDAIIATLSARLGLAGREDEARDALATREAMLDGLEDDAARFADAENLAYQRAASSLLARFPVINDPWHPDFESTLREHEDEVLHFFEGSREIAEWRRSQAGTSDVSERIALLTVDLAPYRRLVRALDDRVLASRLHAVGGAEWARYERFLACERGALDEAR